MLGRTDISVFRETYTTAAGSDTAVLFLVPRPLPGRLRPLRFEHGGVLNHYVVEVEIG